MSLARRCDNHGIVWLDYISAEVEQFNISAEVEECTTNVRSSPQVEEFTKTRFARS